jgi:uncharacterized protein
METPGDNATSQYRDKYPYRILALDGGGSKGVYTLGVLKEFEALIQTSLAQHFDLIYGTSTGAIIAALLALGLTVSAAEEKYFSLIPEVMKGRTSWARSRALRRRVEETFGTRKFDEFQTEIGIVASNYERECPIVFKNDKSRAFRGKATFEPGFGCTISDAILASTAAFPFFRRLHVNTANAGSPEVMDGGFVANNPTLFAIADAVGILSIPRTALRILSVGVGHYKEPQKNLYSRLLFSLFPFKMMNKEFALNTNTIERLRQLFFSDIECVRIDESYTDSQYETDLLEADPLKLRKLFVLGRESFRNFEAEVEKLLKG